MREQLKRVARESQNGIWPEYAELDCFACHHNLVAAKDSWRQERGYAGPGRRPGNAPFNLSRFVVLNHVIQDADPGATGELKAGIDRVYAGVTALNANRQQVSSEATGVSELAGRLATRLNGMKFDPPQTLRLLKSISGDEGIAGQGERAAEQATMALDSLFIAYSKNGKLANDTQIRAAINGIVPAAGQSIRLRRLQVCGGDEEPQRIDRIGHQMLFARILFAVRPWPLPSAWRSRVRRFIAIRIRGPIRWCSPRPMSRRWWQQTAVVGELGCDGDRGHRPAGRHPGDL